MTEQQYRAAWAETQLQLAFVEEMLRLIHERPKEEREKLERFTETWRRQAQAVGAQRYEILIQARKARLLS